MSTQNSCVRTHSVLLGSQKAPVWSAQSSRGSPTHEDFSHEAIGPRANLLGTILGTGGHHGSISKLLRIRGLGVSLPEAASLFTFTILLEHSGLGTLVPSSTPSGAPREAPSAGKTVPTFYCENVLARSKADSFPVTAVHCPPPPLHAPSPPRPPRPPCTSLPAVPPGPSRSHISRFGAGLHILSWPKLYIHNISVLLLGS